MRPTLELGLLIVILVLCTALSVGLTYAPCYSSLCLERFLPYETRLHIATYYALVASIAVVLFLRAVNPTARRISNYYLISREVPILGKRVSIGGLALSIWVLGLTLATTPFWLNLLPYWAKKTDSLGMWDTAKVRLTVTGIIGHHADIPLGLLLIPVGRNSIIGRVFSLHTSTLLYAHKLLAYLTFIAGLAHGAAYYTFVGAYRGQPDVRKEAFDIDNPYFSEADLAREGTWWKATLPTGMLGFLAMLVIVITALPILRRKSYNTFYYLHIILSISAVIALSIHCSTDFYFMLPGLILWAGDWAWRLFRGMGGLRKRVVGTVENAGAGWYRISLPVSAKLPTSHEDVEAEAVEKIVPTHPLQTYFLVFPSISRLQNHAFTACKVGSAEKGPTFLFQRATGKKEKKLNKEWTWKLGAEVNDQDVPSKALDVRVEGPYIPSVPGMFSASRIVCIVGGTGLTGAYSIALWWLKYRAQVSNARMTLVWTIRHRETASVRDWQELEALVADEPRIRLVVQVTSEQGRLDATSILRQELSKLPEDKEGSSIDDKAWVYISGPEGLLTSGESACLEVRKHMKSESDAFGVRELDFYAAKWEV